MSIYFDKFQKLKEELGDQVVLRGSSLLIEPLDEGEEGIRKTKSGLYIADDPSHKIGSVNFNKAHVAKVLMVGEGYFNPDTGDYTECDVRVGDVVIYKKENAMHLSTFPGILDLTKNKLAIVDENYLLYIIRGGEPTLKRIEGILN